MKDTPISAVRIGLMAWIQKAVSSSRVKSGNFRQRVNSDTHLQTVEIQMRWLIMSRLIRIFTVCLVNLFFIPIIQIWIKQDRCPNLADCPNLFGFTLLCPGLTYLYYSALTSVLKINIKLFCAQLN